jgi:hypothetical protein
MNKFKKAGWPYVHRHYASKGVADIVAIRKTYDLAWGPEFFCQVVFVQCKFEATKQAHTKEKKALIQLAKSCWATPIWATKYDGKFQSAHRGIILMNLLNNRLFIL